VFDVGEDFLLLVVDPSTKGCIPGGGAELFVEHYLRSCKKVMVLYLFYVVRNGSYRG
jgi:hypothetical protein